MKNVADYLIAKKTAILLEQITEEAVLCKMVLVFLLVKPLALTR